jgi:peptidoglycan/LPS O-acetylase OafA/YrhL
VVGAMAYPLYLLHLPITRYYWIATRGYDAQFFWPLVSFYFAGLRLCRVPIFHI